MCIKVVTIALFPSQVIRVLFKLSAAINALVNPPHVFEYLQVFLPTEKTSSPKSMSHWADPINTFNLESAGNHHERLITGNEVRKTKLTLAVPIFIFQLMTSEIRLNVNIYI